MKIFNLTLWAIVLGIVIAAFTDTWQGIVVAIAAAFYAVSYQRTRQNEHVDALNTEKDELLYALGAIKGYTYKRETDEDAWINETASRALEKVKS
jgi:hypothetical protein